MAIVKEVEAGPQVAEMCRWRGVSATNDVLRVEEQARPQLIGRDLLSGSADPLLQSPSKVRFSYHRDLPRTV